MKTKIGLLAILMLLSIALSPSLFSLAVLLSAFLHELGHIAAAKLLKIELKELSIGAFGAGLTPSSSLFSFKKEMLLCAAGPLVNLVCFLILLPFKNLFLNYVSVASLFLGALNLLPITSFDGGRILYSFISRYFTPRTALNITRFLSFIFIFSLWCFSLYLLMRVAISLSLFIFSCSLFLKIFLSESA